MNYFRKLTMAGSGESSKRFQSLGAFFLLSILVISALFGFIVPEVYIYALVSLCLGSSAMSLVTRNNSYTEKTQSTVKYDAEGNYLKDGISEEEMKI